MFKKRVLKFIAKHLNDSTICEIVDYYLQWNKMEGIESNVTYKDKTKATLKIYKKFIK